MPQQEFVSESHPRHPTAYLGRMRREQEDLVLAGDNPKGMRTTILRPPDFYGPDSELSYVRAIFDATLKGGTANVIGPIVQDPDSSQRGNSLNRCSAPSETPPSHCRQVHAAPPGMVQPVSP